MTSWRCITCPAGSTEGTWAQADRQADKHTKDTQHTTITTTVGSTRVRDGKTVRNMRGAM